MKTSFLLNSAAIILSFGLWACGDDSSSNANVNDPESSESSVSSGVDTAALSSSEELAESSSGTETSSESNQQLPVDQPSSSSTAQPTSSNSESIESSSETAADTIWHFYEDHDDACKITATPTFYKDYDFYGLVGKVDCQDGKTTYAGATQRVYETEQNATDWGGLCVIYKSENYIVIGLIPEDATNYSENINYQQTLNPVDSLVTVEIPWEDFERNHGFSNFVVKKEDFLTHIVGYFMQMEHTLVDKEGNYHGAFEIQKIGPKGTCGTPTEGKFYW